MQNGMGPTPYTYTQASQVDPNIQPLPGLLPPYIHDGWSSSICDCCCGQNANPGFFCLACFCSGVAQGVLLKDLGLVSSCVGPAACYTVIDLVFARSFMVLILTSLRISMSDKLKRQEGPCRSFCCACCCYPCALAQLDRDAKAPGQTYEFERTRDPCQVVSTFFGAIHGRAVPYQVNEMQP